MFMPDYLRLPFHTDREAPQVACCDNPKKCGSRLPSALDLYGAKSSAGLRRFTPKKCSCRTTFGCLSTPTARLPRRPAAMTRKRAASDSLRLWIYTEQKVPPAFGDLPPKNVQVRQLPAASSHRPRGLSSDPLRQLEKEQLRTAFGFWSIPCKNPLQRSEMYPKKMFMSDYLRLPFHTDREASQVTRCDDPKKCGSRLPSAFGRSPAKSLSSLRRFTLKKCSCRTTFGCLSTPTAKLPKWPAAMTRKSAAQDRLRLWIYTEQKVPPAFGDVPRKNIHARLPSAASSHRPRDSPSGLLR